MSHFSSFEIYQKRAMSSISFNLGGGEIQLEDDSSEEGEISEDDGDDNADDKDKTSANASENQEGQEQEIKDINLEIPSIQVSEQDAEAILAKSRKRSEAHFQVYNCEEV